MLSRAFLLLSCALAAQGLLPNTSFAAGVPLFAHVRWANFSASDLAGLSRFRSVTVQVEPSSPLPCEAQARDVKARLAGSHTPVLMYGNLFFNEPGCDYAAAFAQRPDLWLNESDGTTPYMPAGRRTFDMSVAATPAWWAAHVIAAAGAVVQHRGVAVGGAGEIVERAAGEGAEAVEVGGEVGEQVGREVEGEQAGEGGVGAPEVDAVAVGNRVGAGGCCLSHRWLPSLVRAR